MNIKKILKSQEGVTLILALLVMSSVAILGVAIVTISQLEVDSSYSITELNSLFYYAEGRTVGLTRRIENDTTFLVGDLGEEIEYNDFLADTYSFDTTATPDSDVLTRSAIYGAGRSAPMAYSNISLSGSADKPKEWWHFFILKAAACRREDKIRYEFGGDVTTIPQKEINTMVRKTYIY